MSMTELCWPIRVEIFKNLQQEGQPKPFMAPGAQLKCWEACLQLAMCYHTGFGVPPDNKTMLRFLTLSLPGNATTKAIYRRVVSALGHGENKEAVDFGFQTEIDRAIEESATGENYFATRIRTYQQYATKKSSLWMNQSPRVNRLALADVVRSGIPSLTAHALRKWKFDDKEISAALCLACKRGLFNVAMQICRYCEKFILEEEGPNPFHWLIMFEDQEAEKLARVLVYGSSENQDGPCREYINRMCTARDGVLYFPEHCLQLFGSPLHWAVRTRNLKLVQLLVQLGADVNVRWSDHQRLHDKAPLSGLKNISALDVAVMFHLPEIIQTLLDSGASTHYQASHYLDRGHLASRFIGWECIPLSRYIVHGEGYRDALKEVLRILNSDGRDLHERVSGGYDSLMAALSNCCERYVVEELLAAGADPTRLHNGSNAALSITRSAHICPYDVANLALVVPRVLDINEPDSTGNNAIHTVAILEAPGMAETISNSPNFKVDMKNAHDMTALHLAAIFGATETLSILIRKQANVECENKVGSTPLELAAIFGQTGAADVLLDAGAEVRFSPGNYTVLHAAVYGKKFPDATLRHLLATHCKLRSKAIIHTTDSFGWTALHKAAHFGDYNAVDALLSYGADPTLGDGHGITPLKLVVKTLDEVQSSGLHHLEHKRILDKGPEAVRAYKTYLQETKRILEDANVHNDSP